jgi:hypothetical protein
MASPQTTTQATIVVGAWPSATAEDGTTEGKEDDWPATAVVGIDSDGRLLMEEEPIRLTFLRFNALGDYQFAHVVDDYTFLEGRRNGVSFRKEFTKHRALVMATHPELMAKFEETVLKDSDQRVYDAAVSTHRRVAERLTIPSCKRCNKAMDREGAHVTATYRCFSVTRDSDVPLLECNSKQAIAAKKVVQQIAFYFLPPDGSAGSTWRAKSDDQLLRDASLWRCIAHLWNWGRSANGGGVRFRMVAMFHVAYYIYLNSSLREGLSFETWHVHCWRPYCMTNFAPNTFLNIRQTEVGICFDLTRKQSDVWCTRVHALAVQAMNEMEASSLYSAEEIDAIVRFETGLTTSGVRSEASLLRFLVQLELRKRKAMSSSQALLRLGDTIFPALPRWMRSKGGHQGDPSKNKEGVNRAAVSYLLGFFRYNLTGAIFQQTQCETLTSELVKTMQHVMAMTAGQAKQGIITTASSAGRRFVAEAVY